MPTRWYDDAVVDYVTTQTKYGSKERTGRGGAFVDDVQFSDNLNVLDDEDDDLDDDDDEHFYVVL